MTQPDFRNWRRAFAALTIVFLPAVALAQRPGSQPAAPSGGQPVLLPLSGRGLNGGSTVTTQGPGGSTAGVGSSGPAVQVQGPLVGSVASGSRRPFTGTLTFPDAIQRGLEFNLGALNVAAAVKQSQGQRGVARSVLLPNLTADFSETRQKINLAAFGLQISTPSTGPLPTVVGPYNNVDLRVRLSQAVLDLTGWHNYQAAIEMLRAQELTAEDTRDLIVLAAGGSYIQAVAARARVTSGQAQLDTATALYQQNVQRRAVGLTAQVDVDRSQVQMLTQQQRLISLQNDFAKQKINLARMIGLPPTEQYELARDVSYQIATTTLDDVLRQAREQRADLKAAEAQVRAAERALDAARAERLPSVSVNADFGTIGMTLSDARGTYAIVGAVRVPLWQGGRTEAQIQQADAVLAQRRAELEDLGSQIEGDIRKSYLDLQAATSQVGVAQKNRDVAQETLDLTRQRFEAGVSDNVEVVQAQESLAGAELDYINSVFSHSVAKLSLARAMGQATTHVAEFFKAP